jgi:predicted anti-sigma-YlaC factor YlaD
MEPSRRSCLFGPWACIFALLLWIMTGGCSIKRLAMNQVANAMTQATGGRTFTGDNDPELVGAALPFAIKLYEALLEGMPRHEGLQLRTGSLYVMYANAFLYTPAAMLSKEEYRRQESEFKRAKNLYLRGRDILLDGLEKRYPGLRNDLKQKRYDGVLKRVDKRHVSFLYWAGAGWLGAFAIDPFDMDLGMTIPAAAALMERVLALEPGFGNGSIHEFYVLYYGSLPEYMGGDAAKARSHFKLAMEQSRNSSTSAPLNLAATVSVSEQDIGEFRELLTSVLRINPDGDPDNRLLITINQRRARWLLEHVDDLFVELDEAGAVSSEEMK